MIRIPLTLIRASCYTIAASAVWLFGYALWRLTDTLNFR